MSNILQNRIDELRDASRNAKAFKVLMMGGKEPMKVDADELAKIAHAVQTGASCWVRQGNFNPRSYSHIIEDGERLQDFRREIDARASKAVLLGYENLSDEELEKRLPTVPRLKLKSIFTGVNLQSLPANNTPQIAS